MMKKVFVFGLALLFVSMIGNSAIIYVKNVNSKYSITPGDVLVLPNYKQELDYLHFIKSTRKIIVLYNPSKGTNKVATLGIGDVLKMGNYKLKINFIYGNSTVEIIINKINTENNKKVNPFFGQFFGILSNLGILLPFTLTNIIFNYMTPSVEQNHGTSNGVSNYMPIQATALAKAYGKNIKPGEYRCFEKDFCIGLARINKFYVPNSGEQNGYIVELFHGPSSLERTSEVNALVLNQINPMADYFVVNSNNVDYYHIKMLNGAIAVKHIKTELSEYNQEIYVNRPEVVDTQVGATILACNGRIGVKIGLPKYVELTGSNTAGVFDIQKDTFVIYNINMIKIYPVNGKTPDNEELNGNLMSVGDNVTIKNPKTGQELTIVLLDVDPSYQSNTATVSVTLKVIPKC